MKEPYEKVILGRCEIHIYRRPENYALEIPVVRLSRERGLPLKVQSYLEDRNEHHQGPGLFTVTKEIIWYRAVADNEEDLNDTMLACQNVVERLGPKILNLMK